MTTSLSRFPSKQQRAKMRARREHKRVLKGMLQGECWFFTLTKGRGRAITIRSDGWHALLTRMKQEWPECETWNVYEFGEQRGVHLHVVVRGADGLTEEWIASVLKKHGDGTKVGGFEPVFDPVKLAWYVTKQLRNWDMVRRWPRNHRPVSATRKWVTTEVPESTLSRQRKSA